MPSAPELVLDDKETTGFKQAMFVDAELRRPREPEWIQLAINPNEMIQYQSERRTRRVTEFDRPEQRDELPQRGKAGRSHPGRTGCGPLKIVGAFDCGPARFVPPSGASFAPCFRLFAIRCTSVVRRVARPRREGGTLHGRGEPAGISRKPDLLNAPTLSAACQQPPNRSPGAVDWARNDAPPRSVPLGQPRVGRRRGPDRRAPHKTMMMMSACLFLFFGAKKVKAQTRGPGGAAGSTYPPARVAAHSEIETGAGRAVCSSIDETSDSHLPQRNVRKL